MPFTDSPLIISLEFTHGGYSAGDMVLATAVVKDKQSTPVAAAVRVKCTMGSSVIYSSATATDSTGVVRIAFVLPTILTSDSAVLTLISDQAARSRPVPLIINNMILDVYPEGGMLVQGL